MPRKTSAARPHHPATEPGVFRATIHVRSESTIGKSAKTRLPNSIVECSPIAGKNAPFWQPGHDSQASPDPVSRTAAPVSTTP